jgi:hypothetical protein
MQYARGSIVRLRGVGLDPIEIRRVLERVEASVPHLNFTRWQISDSNHDGEPQGSTNWIGSDNLRNAIALDVQGLHIQGQCRRDEGPISRHDHRFLDALSREAARTIASASSGLISLVEFGSRAVADEIRSRAGLAFDPLPVLQFIRALSQETYENQRLAYGLILSRAQGEGALLSEAFENKRFKKVTDGFSTGLVLDREGRILELAALTTPVREGLALSRRPWWVGSLAEAARSRRGLGIALTRNGDLLIVEQRRLVFTQRAGVWRKWDHAAILGRLRSLWDLRGRPHEIDRVLTYLYHVALDLSFRRSGGLLVVAGSEERVRSLLTSPTDIVDSQRRTGPEKALDGSLAGRAIFRSDRRVVADLASMDGALVVDRTGRLWAYAAMTQASRSAQQGARTRAAYAASRAGVAIKISADGDISFFRRGRKRFEI